MEPAPIDTANKFVAGTAGNGSVFLIKPPAPGEPLSREDALLLAAWLVALADPEGLRFEAVLDAVCNP